MKRQLVLYGPVLIFGAGALGLVHAAHPPRHFPWAVAYAAVALLALPAVDLALRRSGFRGDPLLLPLTSGLLGAGLVTLYRLAPELAARQATALCAGLVAMAGISQLASRPRVVERAGRAWGLVFLALVAVPLLLPGGEGFLAPSLRPGPGAFQLLGVAFVGFVVFAACELASERRVHFAAVTVAAVLLLVLQGDVSGAATVLVTSLGAWYVATGISTLVLAAAGAGALVLLAQPLLAELEPPVPGWLGPWSNPTGSGDQTLQAIFALASGGLFGAGPGAGHPDLVPAAHTHLTLAAFAEEWGFAGTLAVLTLYGLWTARVLRAAIAARHPSSRLLAAGVAVAVGAQAFLGSAGNLRLVPLLGLPLPFLSYGGSWLLGHLALLGLALGVSHQSGEM